MSTLGKIAVQSLKPFARLLGPNGEPSTFAIGDSGPLWEGTIDERRTTRDYMEGGQQVEILQTIVGSSDEFVAQYPENPDYYEGLDASLDGAALTVAEIEVGEAFTRITLNGPNQAP